MIRPFLVAASLSIVSATTATAQHQSHAFPIAQEVERLATAHSFWPGYDPMAIPLAIFDGRQTYLFRHPAPPEGFVPATGAQPRAHVYEGRHAAVIANSSADIGGVSTATVIADGPRAELPPARLAAVALHEAFHVFQRRKHPAWAGNEADLLLYPIDDARLLALRRLETESLRRALASPDSSGSACWAARALTSRRERFSGLDSAFSTYERLSELNEGIAQYIQIVAGGETGVQIPAEGFPAADVRARVYAIGPAFALLLDRVAPNWKALLEANDRQTLDGMLAVALDSETATDRCAFTAAELARVDSIARDDAAAVVAERADRRKAFNARPGWRVIVRAAEGAPLWPQGFDPLNLERVDGGLLHTRFVRIGNEAGQLSVIDEAGADLETLTEALGAHPLFNGVRQVTIAGLARPEIQTAGGRVTLTAPGLAVTFDKATVRESGAELVIELEPAEDSAP